jgi:hypothetical protein
MRIAIELMMQLYRKGNYQRNLRQRRMKEVKLLFTLNSLGDAFSSFPPLTNVKKSQINLFLFFSFLLINHKYSTVMLTFSFFPLQSSFFLNNKSKGLFRLRDRKIHQRSFETNSISKLYFQLNIQIYFGKKPSNVHFFVLYLTDYFQRNLFQEKNFFLLMEESEMERIFSFVLFSLLSYFLLGSVEAEISLSLFFIKHSI